MRVHFPEPTTFAGARDTRNLENFPWDIEQYFRTTRVADDEHIQVCAAYLVDDAKL